MSGKKSIKGKVVCEYLEKYPDMPKKTLAGLIYNNESLLFTDKEQVRKIIRYYTGSSGKRQRLSIPKEKINIKKPFGWNKIPEGETQGIDWTNPYEIKGHKCLLLSDVHVPFHDKGALVTALEYGYKNGIDTIFLNGDWHDCYQQSRYVRDPRMRSWKEELDMSRQILQQIRNNFEDADIIYKEGNHDFRWEQYLIIKAPELLGIPEFELKNMLRLPSLNIEHLPSLRWAKFGKLAIAHGHEGGRGFTNPVNAARGIFLKAFMSIIIGHYHQASSHSENTWDYQSIGTWSTGCLCDLHPQYAPKNKWSHGFALLERTSESGSFIVNNKKIINGRVVPV